MLVQHLTILAPISSPNIDGIDPGVLDFFIFRNYEIVCDSMIPDSDSFSQYIQVSHFFSHLEVRDAHNIVGTILCRYDEHLSRHYIKQTKYDQEKIQGI